MVLTFLKVFVLISLMQLAATEIVEVPDYWPEVKDDLTKVIWSHATNSKQKLKDAIEGDTMMIEADVNLGVLEGTLDIIPIMAHPPAVISDLSLEQFLETVIQALDQGGPELKKGIKLDFKSNQVIEPALQILESKLDRVQFPVWVNGDVVKGPHRDGSGSDPRIIAPEVLFSLADQYIPTATVSPGFTTSHPALNPEYTMEQVENMIQALDQNGYFNTGKRLTFPVRAVYAAVSFDVLKSLLDRTSENNHGVDSTLTLWGTDKLDEQEVLNLFTFIEDIGKNRVYFDVKFD